MFNPGFTSPNLLNIAGSLRATGPSPSSVALSSAFTLTDPARLVRFRSPLLTESLLLSFPPGTEMFQFPGFALHTYAFSVQ